MMEQTSNRVTKLNPSVLKRCSSYINFDIFGNTPKLYLEAPLSRLELQFVTGPIFQDGIKANTIYEQEPSLIHVGKKVYISHRRLNRTFMVVSFKGCIPQEINPSENQYRYRKDLS